MFKEHAVSTKAPKSSGAQRQRLKYTWNPVPAGVIGVDLSRWNDDGTRAEEDAPVPAEKTITKPLPCWAWPGGDGQRRDGAEQWVTEMDSVVDEMFEALAASSTDNAAGSPRAKQPASSTAGDGGGSDLTSARTIFDSSLLGRSRVAAGVVGLRRCGICVRNILAAQMLHVCVNPCLPLQQTSWEREARRWTSIVAICGVHITTPEQRG